MEEEKNIFVGIFWGFLLSIPLWIAAFGWLDTIIHFFKL